MLAKEAAKAALLNWLRLSPEKVEENVTVTAEDELAEETPAATRALATTEEIADLSWADSASVVVE